MKKMILFSVMVFAFFLALAGESKMKRPVQVVSKRMNVFYFRVDKTFLGAELNVYSEDGTRLFSQTVSERRVLVDFHYKDQGKYVIRLSKGNVYEEFTFIKATPCPPYEVTDGILVIQGI